ncbi:histone-lysine N-methyltransferase SETDB1-A-like isoform X2 [Mugil cephalus]|uniref:histone-lysine N-methyltransferase SETDB1-A-like isoform X2 n=1 Tax=Mugil cephalus TaxID=48193 RepID=UPI001FB5AE5F|nr:histone-lysine N-methyltransferase SETDB1-A-like isoform X2 [Mugil cephalus]
MDGDEIEMTKEELQMWIRDRVKKSRLTSPDVQKKCSRLRSVIERREKLAADFLKLCESVAACEEIAKKQYSLLGWEYKDSDSDEEEDDDNPTGRVHFPSETQDHNRPTSKVPLALSPNLGNNERDNGKQSPLPLKRKLVVVLTRLPSSALPQPSPHNSEDESLSSPESDMSWEPKTDSGDSDCSLSSVSNKRRKLSHGSKKCGKTHEMSSLSADSDARNTGARTSTPTARMSASSDVSGAKTSTTRASANTDAQIDATKTLQTNTDSRTKGKAVNTSNNAQGLVPALQIFVGSLKPQATKKPQKQKEATKNPQKQKEASKTTKTTPCVPQGDVEATKTTPCASQVEVQSTKTTPHRVPKGEIRLDMAVVARKSSFSWHQGTVCVIITKEDGKLKYKVSFKDKGKSLVSGHHIAFDTIPKLDYLYLGARVAVKCEVEPSEFLPAVLAEMPSRKNHMRFLVFFDNSTPAYVNLPCLRLVYRPLPDPLADIKNNNHRSFVREYIRLWPYPPQTTYRAGQTLKVEFKGQQEKCEILKIDCSLIQVVFLNDQHKEWVYRGSFRLEHMARMLQVTGH